MPNIALIPVCLAPESGYSGTHQSMSAFVPGAVIWRTAWRSRSGDDGLTAKRLLAEVIGRVPFASDLRPLRPCGFWGEDT